MCCITWPLFLLAVPFVLHQTRHLLMFSVVAKRRRSQYNVASNQPPSSHLALLSYYYTQRKGRTVSSAPSNLVRKHASSSIKETVLTRGTRKASPPSFSLRSCYWYTTENATTPAMAAIPPASCSVGEGRTWQESMVGRMGAGESWVF